MTSTPEPTTSAPTTRPTASQPPTSRRLASQVFITVATLEALSWLALLIGMYFKWIAQSTDRGVQIFGMVHGIVFMCYLVALVWVARSRRWDTRTALLGAVSSIPPFMTLWFERWALRRELLQPRG